MRQTITTITTLLSLLTIISFGQAKTLKGIVTDGHRNPIISCNIIVKGTTTGTVTNDCGEFSVPIDTDEFTLLFHGMSYYDLRTFEIKLKAKDIEDNILLFQLGRWKLKNDVCKKTIERKLKKHKVE